jgi:hypothetical protein
MFSIRNLKLRYLILDLKILALKKSVDPSQRNDTRFKLILVDPVEDEDVEDSSRDWSSNFDNVRSKEKKDYHSSDRSIITFILLYIGFGNLNIYILLWSQINVLSSIRLTGGQQNDFKVFKPLKAKEKYFLES